MEEPLERFSVIAVATHVCFLCRRRTLTKAPSKILSIVVALTFAGALFMTANARITSAHRAAASLPTVRMDYFEGGEGKLARFLDPALVSLATDADTIDLYLAGPVYIGTDDKTHLGLVQKYSISKNRKVYTFTIRDAKYFDGHTVKASDFKYAIERSLAPSTGSDVATTYLGTVQGALDFNNGKASGVSGVKVLNSKTFSVTLTKPYAFFLKQFTYETSWPLDPAVVRGKTAAKTNNYLTHNCPATRATSTGQFLFQCSGSDFFPAGTTPIYTMVPNPKFYGKKAHVRLTFPAYNTVDTGYKAYLAGSIDVTGIPTGFIAQWKKNPRKQYIEFGTSIVDYLTPNSHMAPMNDVHCRLAVAYGINRSLLMNQIRHGTRLPAYSVVPKGFLGYYSGKDSPHFNLKKAQAEFKACGTRSTAFKLVYPTGSSDTDNQFNETNSELRKVGFSVTLSALSGNDWDNVVAQSLDKTQTVLVSNGWQQDYPDPQDYVTTLLRCGNDYDIGGWCNSTFTKLVDKADLEGNTAKRAAEYIQAQKIAIGAGAWITLDFRIGHALIKPCVHGLIGTVAYGDIVPKSQDWSNVSKSGAC